MAPLHPLRHETRAFAARAGACLIVLLTVLLVLLAGGGNGQLANADANKGDTGAGDAAVVTQDPVEEPVLGEPTPAEPPVTGAPPAEEPPDVNVPPDEPSAPGEGESESPGSGGQKGDEDGAAPDEGDTGEGEGDPSGGGTTDEEVPPPSGGSKGDEPTGEDGNEEPGPSGRPQVTLPAAQNASGTEGDTGVEPSVQDPAPGSGTGAVSDSGNASGEGPETRDRNLRSTTSGGDTGTGGTPAGDGDVAGGGADTPVSDTGAGTGTGTPVAGGDGSADQSSGVQGDRESGPAPNQDDEPNVVTRTVEDIVRVVPDSLKAALAALAALSVLLGIGYMLAAMRARRLARQRRELLQEVGLLQTALLPPVPEKVGALRTSVAYRPADGPGAGGDFYDVLPLPGGRAGFILGDVSGHGRGALARTAFMRYTLRAYLEAGLEPRVALQVAGRVIDDNLGGDFATVLLAVHDPETGSLTYATAGHPAPIVVGPQPHDPVTAGSSPPIGVGVRTGLRQTTVPLVPGSVAALFTDGLLEARTEGGILGRERLAELLDEIGPDASARGLIESVAREANVRSDDMAAVVVMPTSGVTAGLFRTEQLELSARELEGPIARRFLEACGLPEEEVEDVERDARVLAERFGGVVLHVVFGNRLRVEVLPRNVDSIEAASRRVSAASAG